MNLKGIEMKLTVVNYPLDYELWKELYDCDDLCNDVWHQVWSEISEVVFNRVNGELLMGRLVEDEIN